MLRRAITHVAGAKRFAWWLPVFGLVLLVAGCGGGKLGSHVAGKVTLDGEPLAEGTISFVAVDGQTATAGATISNGTYSLDLPPGPKKVEITATKVVGTRPTYEGDPNSPMENTTKQIIPVRYNEKTELTREVAPGKNTFDFDLKSA